MTESMDFAALGDDVAANEPTRKMTLEPETVSETVKNGSETVSETVSHPVDAADFAGAGVAALDAGVTYAFGDGGHLTETEKNGFLSLFQRTADHFGLTAHISGGKGLALMAAGKILAVLFPRLADAVQREHFKQTFFGAEEHDLRDASDDGNESAGAAGDDGDHHHNDQ